MTQKIYTPTASIAIRGTSFIVDVKKDDGRTILSMINGTVLVKNDFKKSIKFYICWIQNRNIIKF